MKKSLNAKFATIFLSLLLALSIVLLISVQIVARLFTDDFIKDDVLSAHDTIASEITDILNEVNYGFTRIMQSEQLQTVASGGETSQQAFDSMLSAVPLSDDYLNIVMSFDGIVYCQYDKYDLPSKSFSNTVLQGTNILYCGEVNVDDGYVQIGRRFQSADYANSFVVFYVKSSVLNDVCALSQFVGYTQLLTNKREILAKSTGEDVGKSILEADKFPLENRSVVSKQIDGNDSLVVTTQVNNQYNLDWYVVSVLDNYELQKGFITLSIVLIVIALVSFVLVLILAIKIAKSTVAPINQLSDQLSSVDFQKRRGMLDIGGHGDELYELERNYDEMLARLFKLMDENKENMEIQRKLEIDALQMQINPHFLYNTLDAIAWMAKIKKQNEIEKLVINLAKFFRLSLHKGDKYIYIREETELIEHFLEIEKIRFPNTINYVCSLSDGTGDYKTLKLILQPIVENCIKHGFANKDGVGTINISARLEGEDIIIDVADDGCGFEVPNDFWTKKPDRPNGYGLYNVNERIRLEYGEGYGLSIRSKVGEGTVVTVRIKKQV